MKIAARLCFVIACAQILISVVLIAISLGGRLVFFQMPPMALIGGVLFITGGLTFIAGGVIGIVGWKREDGDKVFALLNGTFALGLLALISIGLVLNHFKKQETEARMAEYKQEREIAEQKATYDAYVEAASNKDAYHDMLWEAKVVLLPSTIGARRLDSAEILGYRVITIPEIDLDEDFAAGALLAHCDRNLKRLILSVLKQPDEQISDRLLDFLGKHDFKPFLRIGDDYKRLGDGYEVHANRETVIMALEQDLD